MSRAIRSKKPNEARTLPFNFFAKLRAGDSLTGTPTVTAPAGITAGAPTISGTTVNVPLSGGTDGQNYVVKVTVSTALAEILELDVSIEVRETTN